VTNQEWVRLRDDLAKYLKWRQRAEAAEAMGKHLYQRIEQLEAGLREFVRDGYCDPMDPAVIRARALLAAQAAVKEPRG
jgi:hypothetical protein